MTSLASKRVVVTGGSGFLGRHVTAALAGRGATVLVPRKAQYDLTHESDVIRMFADLTPQIVVHLAAVVGGIGANREFPGRFFFENMMLGALTMEHARRAGVEKFVGIGTICAYPKLAPVPFLIGGGLRSLDNNLMASIEVTSDQPIVVGMQMANGPLNAVPCNALPK